MSGPPERSFSFNYDDESALQHRGQGYQQQYSQHSQPYQDEPVASPVDDPRGQQIPSSYDAPPPPPAHRNIPTSMHPGSTYSQMQAQTQYGGQQESLPRTHTVPRRPLSQSPPPTYGGAPAPNTSRPRRQSDTTPGMDNLGTAAAGGGIAGIAMGVASTNERESGLQALRDIDSLYRSDAIPGSRHTPAERRFNQDDDSSYGSYSQQAAPRRPLDPQPSYSSTLPLAATGYAPGAASRAESASDRSSTLNNDRHSQSYAYADTPYDQYSSSNLRLAPAMAAIDPNSIADDGDDDFAQAQHGQKRRSILPFGNRTSSHSRAVPGAAGVGAGAAAGGAFAFGARDASGNYNAVPTHGAHDSVGGGGGGGIGEPELVEKSDWLNRQNSGNKRLKWIVGTIVVLVLIGGIVGGVIGGVLAHKNSNSSSSKSSAQSVANDNKSDLDKNSAEIQQLMGNTNLHKVFPGMDYTPLNAQYPDCINSPPSQNNVTRDMAVLSQLTNAVRLYGTDCNQTEMVLHAIDKLELTDMKVWLGVWLGNNDTTNDRQLAQMWTILNDNKAKAADLFKGVIVGNEVLYRKDLTLAELSTILSDVKKNLTAEGFDFPLATSDLGDNWTSGLVQDVDIVMSNIHPFFAGATAEAAAAWTWTFWQGKDVALTQGTSTKQIISEVGWPSAGGNDCGAADCTSDTQGSIAGIDEMNTFMDNWVCQSLVNGTEYFWFEAFDEPWKIEFDTPGKNWEDKWGLMDINRNLKTGLKIPDCGGNTTSS